MSDRSGSRVVSAVAVLLIAIVLVFGCVLQGAAPEAALLFVWPALLAAMVLTIGVTSNYAQYLLDGPSFGGMSGVVFGLFGYVLVMSRFAPSAGMVMATNNAIFMGIWFAVCLTGAIGPIANGAHGVGLALGLGFGGIGVWLHERRRR